MKVYLIGSLRNPEVPNTAKFIREVVGCDVFDDWFAAGPEADDWWQKYEKARGHDFAQALAGHAGQHVYKYDKSHLDSSHVGVLMLPAGKSGHLEAGYLIGQGKSVYIIGPEPERYDVMYNFARGFFNDLNRLCDALRAEALTHRDKIVSRAPFFTFTPIPDPHWMEPAFRLDHLPEGSV